MNSGDFREKIKKQYIFFINAFSLLAIAALLIFSFVNFASYNPFLGFIEFIVAAVLLVNILLLRQTKRPELASRVLLGGVYILLLTLFVTGGIEKTGIYWYFTFPPAAFFLTNKWSAVKWVVLLYGSTLALMGIEAMGMLKLSYDPVQVRQLLAAHVVVCATLFIYENTRKAFENEVTEHQK